jgi:hypothetical protein
MRPQLVLDADRLFVDDVCKFRGNGYVLDIAPDVGVAQPLRENSRAEYEIIRARALALPNRK